jgi:hypothetical protein
MKDTLPQRIKPRKTYPVGKNAREALMHYLYVIDSQATDLLYSGEYKDYDWTELMDDSELYHQVHTQLLHDMCFDKHKGAGLDYQNFIEGVPQHGGIREYLDYCDKKSL